ncbi:MAG: hypothetical protein K8F91_21520 [Candidatus Obscuribacterales bacterium]|nr:hypothetical protein [Candidatus Obscuribacterales bacterium]
MSGNSLPLPGAQASFSLDTGTDIFSQVLTRTIRSVVSPEIAFEEKMKPTSLTTSLSMTNNSSGQCSCSDDHENIQPIGPRIFVETRAQGEPVFMSEQDMSEAVVVPPTGKIKCTPSSASEYIGLSEETRIDIDELDPAF